MPTPRFALNEKPRAAAARKSVSVTPNDGTDLADGVCQGIVVSSAGAVAWHNELGVAQAAVYLAAGVIHPVEARRILSTGTTATGIVAVYTDT